MRCPRPYRSTNPGPISFCSVFGGELPIIGRLPYCQKKKVEVNVGGNSGGPITVPIER
jgi:hypothetical protein